MRVHFLIFTVLTLVCLAQAHSHSHVHRRRLSTRGELQNPDQVLGSLDEHADNSEQHTYHGLEGDTWGLNTLQDKTHGDANKQDTSKVRPNYGASKGDYESTSSAQSVALGDGAWKVAYDKARQYVGQFGLEDRVKLVTGVGWNVGPAPHCVGNIAANDRLGFPGLCLEDSPLGVRFADLVSVFPSGISTAATFSSELAYARGRAMGQEHRRKGVNVQLGPGMNLHRTPAGGRNWEMAGADPYLSGEAAYQTIKGIQSQGVQACAKHLIGNEQEINRNRYSSNIDGRTLREIYLHPFMRSVQADVASMMCSYNLLNQTWACQNDYLLNDVLKTELGFQGFVVSDWGAQHSGVASALAGLDMTMPGQTVCCDKHINDSFWAGNLTAAVNNGSVPASRVEDMATRILASWYFVGQDSKDYPKPSFDAFDSFYGEHTNVMTEQHSQLIRTIGAAGSVLLKNKGDALPLKKSLRKLAVIGADAGPAQDGANGFSDRGGVDGVVGVGWGSGTAEYSYLISPYEALQARARQTNTGFYWSFDNFATGRAMTVSDERLGVDAAIVFVHANSGEEYITVDGNMGDRNNLTLWANGDNLIANVTSVQSNTIVVVHGPGQVDMEGWIDNPNVTAVIHGHMPGAEAGNAIADILYGDVNPSGRLPYTIAKQRSDYGADVQYFKRKATASSQLNYDDKLNIDYRHFDASGIQPRFEFGFGLSYTQFSYTNLAGRWVNSGGAEEDWNARNWALPLPSWLFEDVYEVTFDVTNSGSRDGYEVPQLYIGFPSAAGEPPKVLRKFDRFAIDVGQTRPITFTLNRYDLSIYDNVSSRWSKPEGSVKLFVGASSRDIRLTKEAI